MNKREQTEVVETFRMLSDVIHQGNIERGFYEGKKNIGEMLCLIHSEVSEALEADRKDVYAKNEGMNLSRVLSDDEVFKSAFTEEVKDSFEDELADILIRVFDLARHKNIDIGKYVIMKMRYNSLREYKHGKKY